MVAGGAGSKSLFAISISQQFHLLNIRTDVGREVVHALLQQKKT
jgi:hypothetical protein